MKSNPSGLSRRQLLGSAAAASGLWMMPVRRALAGTAPGRKFIFVTNLGGWDPTRVMASEFTNPNVDMERDGEARTLGDLTYVDHVDRPSVRSFMETYGQSTAFFNGIMVPSISHESCRKLMMCGSTRQDAADWGAIVAGADGSAYSLPQVVAAGPSFPGAFGVFVTRTGTQGQLPALLNGDIFSWSPENVVGPSNGAEQLMDQYLRQKAEGAAAVATGNDKVLRELFSTSMNRAQTLKELQGQLSWTSSGDFSEQIQFATSLLKLGVSRVVTLQANNSWDSHSNNDATQSTSWESLFSSLLELKAALAAEPGVDGGLTLADETVIVVLSEMGRTPRLNGNLGKDHWPYTAAMVSGPGLQGGRVYGGYDVYYYGRKVDFATGEVDDNYGTNLACDSFGATLLRIAGLDSEEFLAGVGHVEAAVAS